MKKLAVPAGVVDQALEHLTRGAPQLEATILCGEGHVIATAPCGPLDTEVRFVVGYADIVCELLVVGFSDGKTRGGELPRKDLAEVGKSWTLKLKCAVGALPVLP